jgi:hypothetical protein
MKTRVAVVAFLISTGFLAPACTTESEDTFVSTGTVVFLSFEGGFYGIKGDDGRNYDPLNNLPVEFQKEGLRIRFEAKELTDRGSFHMWGKIIEIKHIAKV